MKKEPKRMKGKKTTMHIAVSLSVDGGSPWLLERDVQLENIPGAWRVHGEENEKPPEYTDCPVVPGTGISRREAILDFIGNNYGGRRINSRQVLESIISTYLQRADNDSLDKTVEKLLKDLLPKPSSG